MTLAKGSQITFRSSSGGSVTGVLAEEVSINLQSSFRDIMGEVRNEFTELIDIIGGVSRQLFGKGFSSQWKQQTTQVWEKTQPAEISLNIEVHRTGNSISGQNVVSLVQSLCKNPLPDESDTGNLTPPGPNILNGIGIASLDNLSVVNDNTVNSSMNAIANSAYFNVEIGVLKFNRMVITSAEPTFSKFTDTSGYPISCRIAIKLKSIWVATRKFVDSWATGSSSSSNYREIPTDGRPPEANYHRNL